MSDKQPGVEPIADEDLARLEAEARHAWRGGGYKQLAAIIARLRAAEADVRTVLANLRWLEECTEETLEGEDAEIVRQIERQYATPQGTPAAEARQQVMKKALSRIANGLEECPSGVWISQGEMAAIAANALREPTPPPEQQG